MISLFVRAHVQLYRGELKFHIKYPIVLLSV